MGWWIAIALTCWLMLLSIGVVLLIMVARLQALVETIVSAVHLPHPDEETTAPVQEQLVAPDDVEASPELMDVIVHTPPADAHLNTGTFRGRTPWTHSDEKPPE